MKRKSENIVEEIKQTLEKDQKALPIVAALIVVPLLLFGYYYFALFMGLVLAGLYYLNTKMITKFYGLSLKVDTLQYLLGIRSLFNYAKKYYTKLLGIGMPLIGIPILLFSLEILGIPLGDVFSPEKRWNGLAILPVFAGLFSFLGIFAYRLSTAALYGKDLKKIEEIIEELKP